MDDDLIVCRCEEVTVGDVKRAIEQGDFDVSGVKRRTRAGMGQCQGRTCETLIREILASELSKRPDEFRLDTVRPHYPPVTFKTLAGGYDE